MAARLPPESGRSRLRRLRRSAAAALSAAAVAQPGGGGYTDVAAGVHKPAINALAARGLFEGTLCGENRFCPAEPVTRAQMASFLARAFRLQPAASAGFADVDPQSAHTADINALTAANITAGCATEPLRYCPRQSVTRAQVATFLTRALNIDTTKPAYETVAAGRRHSCAVSADDTITCWGRNTHGQTQPPAIRGRAAAP